MNVLFAVPNFTSQLAVEFVLSALRTERALVDKAIAHEWSVKPGDQFIAKCRNAFVADFLKGDFTDLFFLDDDIGWPEDKVLEFLQRPEPVLAGVYPHKSEDVSFPCSLWPEDGALIERDGLVKATQVPGGFLRIKRWVLRDLYEAAPKYSEQLFDKSWADRAAVFQAGPAQDGRWWGEDYMLCNALHAANVEIWIDPSVPFYHRGTKRWGARLGDSMDVYRAKAREAPKDSTSEAA